MSRYRPNLTLSILAFLGLLLTLAWLLFSLLAFKTAANDLYSQKGEHARILLKTFVSLLPDALPTYPEGFLPPDSQASQYIQKLSEENTFSRLTLLDRNGSVIFSSGKENGDLYSPFQELSKTAEGSFTRPDGNGMVYLLNVTKNGELVGKAGLLLSLAPEKARLNRSRQMLIAYFVLDFFLLFGFGSFVLSRIVVNPVNRILAATEKITGGQYTHRLNVAGSAELASLATAFNDMASTLGSKNSQVAEQMDALEKVNNELRQAREETLRSEKMASIGLLAAGMAHEIGTPLASIMGYAELIASEQPDNPVLQDYSRRISEDSLRIDRIVRGLQEFSRPRVQGFVQTDIREVVYSTRELLDQQGVFKSLQLKIDIADNVLPVKCDPHQLQQVIINLLLNSRDAAPVGGIVAIRVINDSSYVRLDVADNGTGIPEETMKHLFDPFFTTKPPGKGTGLGLAISSRIVEGFGGRITVKSVAGKGSCFTVWLPVAASMESES